MTESPTWKEFCPAMEMFIDTLLLGFTLAFITSAARPPQPFWKGRSGRLLCHWSCWSLWENNCGGTGLVLAIYSVRLIGCTNVPTLETKERSPELNIAWVLAMVGWMPKLV